MENNNQQSQADHGQEKKPTTEGLPMETSPYLKYSDLDDYKRQAYGTEGHLQVKPDQGGGATDAPTLTGQTNARTLPAAEAADHLAKA
ncbi:hypothetical protein Tsubulata_047303 [Turnera subulata]|uniref:Late embryogenesis abundant protein, LEA-18 n=1 Tax=Turnera subulata TaxID=218843 RepID=A0A9Q0GCE1_9ROSI|nr:hypothetical protein Tsubulata_047303 [Turnera subulata]